ncbi:MAG TPA: pantoate--beta-alanine ligase [Actinomycetota bacterium]|nr:pantoate--beta-alanine ligase [Actinomycetota bacterium]
MEVIATREAFADAAATARADGRTVGFVPTMGFLHDGHRSLMTVAREGTDLVAVSIFLNPLQFGPGEDLAAYPRDLDRDLEVCVKEGVDVVFAPDADEMYPDGLPEVTVDPGPMGGRFEGVARPGHFRGVCTVVAKLLGIVGACRAYFGEKDAQQLFIVRRMARDLDLAAEIVGCPTVREPNGVALSSRNTYLSPEERGAAACLYEALARAAWLVEGGERDARVLRAELARRIGAEPLAALDYVAIVDEETFEEVDRVRGPVRALVAARIGSARLIDNLLLRPPD